MNILHTVPSLIPESGGPSRSVTGLCVALSRIGNKVDLLSIDLGRNFETPIIPPSDQVITALIPNSFTFNLRQLWVPGYRSAILAISRKRPVQVIHDHCIWLPTNVAVTQAAHKLKLPFIVSLRGMLEPWAMQNNRRRKQLMWHLYQHRNLESANVLHATAESEANNLRRIGLHQPIAVIPNGVELPAIKPKSPRSVDENRTLLFLSRIHPKKGLLNFVEAFRQIPTDGWQVIIAGPDENGHQAVVENAIRQAGLQHLFHFIGPVNDNDKWDLYQRADLFVLPTFSENFGIVIAEALASQVPVITTTGAPWQELETERCGWWIEPTVEALVTALTSAMTLPDRDRWSMGQRGRRLIENKYGWTSIGKQMLTVYQWVLGEADKPSYVWL